MFHLILLRLLIDNLSKKYQYPVQEYLYVTLTDHIYCSYQAISQGRYKDSNLPDISTKYPTAFQIANEAFEIYRQKLTENLPEDDYSYSLSFYQRRRCE